MTQFEFEELVEEIYEDEEELNTSIMTKIDINEEYEAIITPNERLFPQPYLYRTMIHDKMIYLFLNKKKK